MNCAGGVKDARPHNHAEGGGSIPASALSFFVGRDDDAKRMVLTKHYSGRWPANVQYVFTFHGPGGLFGDCGECEAAAVFSIPPTRWSEPVLELIRLVRDVRQVPLTKLISLSIAHIRREGTCDLIVSFADETQGHKGGVYRACNWRYAGKREPRMDGLIVNGEFTPGRTCNSLWGTRSPHRLQELKPTWNIEPHHDGGKHCFWFPVTKSGEEKAKRIGLESF